MPPTPIRILVAEDYEPFRRFLCSTIQSKPDWRVIGEIADGLEAVQMARQLQPDLVLLDIGLPTLNGIEAARQIRAVSPTSKILFVSKESSPDIVEAAVETGGHGYVNKSDAGSELMPAIQAILLGRKYLSRSVAEANFSQSSLPPLAEEQQRIRSPRPLRNEKSRFHEVAFYADDRSAWGGRARVAAEALNNGNAALVVASASHHGQFLSRLQAHGVDVNAVIEQGRYVAQDVARALSSVMVNDLPDPDNFSKLAGDLIARAAISLGGDTSRVVVCGEGTTRLWEQGNEEGVVRLERLWDEMAKDYGIQVHCGYLASGFDGEGERELFERICAEHSSVRSA